MVPFANEDKFRTVCDWGNWVFPYDDFFDNGVMRNDPVRAKIAMESLVSNFDEESKLESEMLPEMKDIFRVVRFHDTIWQSIRSIASHGMSNLVPRRTCMLTRQASSDATPQQ